MSGQKGSFFEQIINYISLGMPPLQIDGTLAIQIGNLLLLMYILQRLLFKPVKNVLDEREAVIKGHLDKAKTAQDKTESALKMIEGELSEARQKAASILAEMRQQGMAEQMKIIDAAREQGKLLIEKAVKEIQKSASDAKGILSKDAELIATEITSKLLTSTKTAIIILLSIPCIAYAAGGEGGHATFTDWLFRIINFTALASVIGFFLFKFAKDLLIKRRIEVERLFEEAKETETEAKKRLAEIEERVHKKEEEFKAILEDAKIRGEREKIILIEEGNKARAQLEAHAKARIEQELKKAKEDLYNEAVNLSVELAEKKIKKGIGNKEQDGLVKEYLIKIGGSRS